MGTNAMALSILAPSERVHPERADRVSPPYAGDDRGVRR